MRTANSDSLPPLSDRVRREVAKSVRFAVEVERERNRSASGGWHPGPLVTAATALNVAEAAGLMVGLEYTKGKKTDLVISKRDYLEEL